MECIIIHANRANDFLMNRTREFETKWVLRGMDLVSMGSIMMIVGVTS